MSKITEIERRRAEIREEAKRVLEEMRATNDAKSLDRLSHDHDKLMAEWDTLTIDLDELRAEISEKETRESRRPGGNGSMRGVDDPNANALDWRSDSSGWVDGAGAQVRVLHPNDNWAKESRSGVVLGDAVRAMVTGARNEDEKRALAIGTDSAGGYTVPAPLAYDFIDRLRRQSVAVRAGALTVPMTSNTLAIARLDSDPQVDWRAENAAIAEGDPTFSRVEFTAKSLSGIVKVSRELLADSVNVGAMLENALAQAMALELDRASIFGDGTGNSPLGVINISGINEVEMGTNGAALTGYNELIDAIYEMQLDNAGDPTAGIMHPRTGVALAKLKDGDGNPLVVPEMVKKVPLLQTTAAPVDEDQGTATNASSILYGDYSKLLIGMREEVNITFLRERFADTGQIAFLVHLRADAQVAHKASFSRLKGIIPA